MDDDGFIQKFDPHVKTFAYKYCRDNKDLRDFQQNLRIRLWLAYKSHYDPSKGKLSTWVFQTLQLHARKLRFDVLKQEVFERAIIGSDFYHNHCYTNDPYFINVACEIDGRKNNSEHKFKELESSIELTLTSSELSVYNLLMKSNGSYKPSRIAKELKISKKDVELLHASIRRKVRAIYLDLYSTSP
jgi:RNA polymerase sigma factor (sigma-70 family)